MPNYPEVTSRKIKYDSPSGYVSIGKYVPPFEKVKDGFGFMGVVVEDADSGKLQCFICGEWFEQMSQHLTHHHNIDSQEYKRRFGLLMSTALKSKKMRLQQSKIMQNMRLKDKKHRMVFSKNNKWAGNRKGIKKALESKNKYGVCDLQIMQKIIELRNELGKTPTLTQLKDRYGGGFITVLYKRYNSYIKYCNQIGFNPNFSNFNPKYSREYFIEKALNNSPTIRAFTINEGRAFYKYFKGIKELREIVNKIRSKK